MATGDTVRHTSQHSFRQYRLGLLHPVVVQQKFGEGDPQSSVPGGQTQTGTELAPDQGGRQRRLQGGQVLARMPRIRP